MEKKILKAVIVGYRHVIETRYDYERLAEKYDLPAQFNEARIAEIRNFLLEHLYPSPEKRSELNAAFEHLDNYIKDPSKLIRILLDSAMLLFKYGRHLPQILNTGLKALRSFKTVNDFEDKLVTQALVLKEKPPFQAAEIYKFIRGLDKTDVEDFIDSSQSLFETLHNRVLVKKVLEIVQHLIKKMKKRPKVYSEEEVKGLEIGMEIIREGDAIFSSYEPADQKHIIELVIKIERDALEEIY